MLDTAWLVDRVIPEVPVRQWVLSLPYRVRHVCAYDGRARRCAGSFCGPGYYERRARRLGKSRPRAFAVAFVQRFDSALQVNLHYHVLWLDVFAHELREGRVEFCEHAEVTDAEVAKLVAVIRDRVLRYLRRLGKLPRPLVKKRRPPKLRTVAPSCWSNLRLLRAQRRDRSPPASSAGPQVSNGMVQGYSPDRHCHFSRCRIPCR